MLEKGVYTLNSCEKSDTVGRDNILNQIHWLSWTIWPPENVLGFLSGTLPKNFFSITFSGSHCRALYPLACTISISWFWNYECVHLKYSTFREWRCSSRWPVRNYHQVQGFITCWSFWLQDTCDVMVTPCNQTDVSLSDQPNKIMFPFTLSSTHSKNCSAKVFNVL